MSLQLPEPPRRAGPDVIYGSYAPQLWSTFVGDIELPELILNVVWRVGTNGDSEAWTLTVEGARLTSAAGAVDGAVIEVVSDRESWRVGVFDVWQRFIRFVQPNAEAAQRRLPEMLRRHPPQPRIDALAELPGTLDIEYVDDAGDMARFVVRVAGGDGPRGSLRISDQDLWTLLRSKGRVSQLLRTRAQLGGDVGWILRLARLAEDDG